MKNNINNYKKKSIATDVVVLTTDSKPVNNNRLVPEKGIQILLVKRDEEPYKDRWALPAGFVNIGETLTECAKRKLKEKVGLEDIHMEQLCTYGDNLKRDPRGEVVSVAYLALAPKEKIILNSKNASKESAWFWVKGIKEDQWYNKKTNYNIINSTNELNEYIKQLTQEDKNLWNDNKLAFIPVNDTEETVTKLAFDHNEIVADALNRIRNKVMYTDIAFHLVDKLFTMSGLQEVYEVILGKEIQAFRRVIKDKVVQTDEWTDGKAHRPARLYRYGNPQVIKVQRW